jgi:cation transport regulator ChaB
MTVETEVVFPRSMRDMFPAEAQQVYIEAYKQSLAESAKGTNNQLSVEGVAARDAWDAVRRIYVEDTVTHKWHRIDEKDSVPETQPKDQSILGSIKRLFGH